MAKNEKIDATFNIEEEDLGNWVVSLMEEFIENEDLNDYMFSCLPEDYKLSDEQAEIIASVSMNSFLAGVQIGIMDAFDKINMAVAEGYKEFDKVVAADGLSKHLSWEAKMVSEEKLKRYAVNFLNSEIDAIHKTLESVQTDAERDGERRLLSELVRDYKRDLAEIENGLEEYQ